MRFLRFAPSPGEIADYRIKFVPAGEEFTLSGAISLGIPERDPQNESLMIVDMASVQAVHGLQGTFDVYLWAVGENGFPSPPSVTPGVALDFRVPEPPGPPQFSPV